MKLIIQKDRTFTALQADFHQYYPFLKIEAYSKSHQIHELSPEKAHLASDIRLSDIPTFKNEGEYVFYDNTLTGQFEQDLWEQFGLAVQIYRKSGILWLQTSITDDWTLRKQNDDSSIMEQPEKPEEIADYLDTKDRED